MPKKKGGKKGAKIVDGVATNEMTREQLMAHVKRMQLELNREREERNFFMLEREKLYSLWSIMTEELRAAKQEVRLADAKMDENEAERQAEMQIYKQKLRHLMTEQSRRVDEVRLRSLEQMKRLQESSQSVQNSMRETISKKNGEISNTQTSIQTMIRQLQTQHKEQVSRLRMDFCAELQRIEKTFERLLVEREKTQELRENTEIQRTQHEKNEHIQELMNMHEKQMSQMKEFFNEITANNFAVISALQEELCRMKEKEEELKKEVLKGRRDYKKLEATIVKGKEEVEKKLKEDKRSAIKIHERLKKCDERLKWNDKYARMLETTNEALFQKTEIVQKERDVLKGSLIKAILDMQQRANMKKLVLEMKLKALIEEKEKNRPNEGEETDVGGAGDMPRVS